MRPLKDEFQEWWSRARRKQMADRKAGMKAYYTTEEFEGAVMLMGNVIGGTLGALHAAILWGERGEVVPPDVLAKMRGHFQQAKQRLIELMPQYADKINDMRL